mmetsp:Transcript_118336/g.339618  ORF Transcript_118336/g.339618 Transcript_118336/m.339618 type:complete len:278 (+) Transcript_118336:210-1043(+)
MSRRTSLNFSKVTCRCLLMYFEKTTSASVLPKPLASKPHVSHNFWKRLPSKPPAPSANASKVPLTHFQPISSPSSQSLPALMRSRRASAPSPDKPAVARDSAVGANGVATFRRGPLQQAIFHCTSRTGMLFRRATVRIKSRNIEKSILFCWVMTPENMISTSAFRRSFSNSPQSSQSFTISERSIEPACLQKVAKVASTAPQSSSSSVACSLEDDLDLRSAGPFDEDLPRLPLAVPGGDLFSAGSGDVPRLPPCMNFRDLSICSWSCDGNMPFLSAA